MASLRGFRWFFDGQEGHGETVVSRIYHVDR
jgi:hypothetical protein